MKREHNHSFYTLFRLARNIKRLRPMENHMSLFAFEGILAALVLNLINNNNNLFATRLGASDFELSLVIALPQIVGLLVLLPGGILTDRMANKRRMVMLSLVCLTAIYGVLGFVPAMGQYRLIAFLGLLAVSAGPMMMYNASWQAYFSDVVSIEDRNRTYTLRTRFTFLVGIITPLMTGALLSSATANEDKIKIHQSFFWTACVLLILQMLVLKRISGGNIRRQSVFGLKELKQAAVELVHNKKFMGFAGIALFFYMSWHADWTLYYLGQIHYLQMNEAMMSYVNVGGALVQLLTIGFWSRVNEKLGVQFPIIIGTLALALFPLVMIFATSLPLSIGPMVFVVLAALSNFAFATIFLNILQCLLQVVPEANKTLYISIYTVLTTLSNAVMPMMGVKVYSAFGGDLKAFHITFLLIFILRIVSAGLWTLRWWLLRKEPK